MLSTSTVAPPASTATAMGVGRDETGCQVEWLATDVDGTLLDHHHCISPSTISAYRELRSRGVKIIPATGRTVRALWRVAKESDIAFAENELCMYPGIYANGAVVVGEHADDIIYKSLMPAELLVLFSSVCYQWQAQREKETGVKPSLHILAVHTTGMLLDFAGDMWETYEKALWEEEGDPINAKFQHVDQISKFDFTHASALSQPENIVDLLKFIKADKAFQAQAEQAGLQTVSPIPYLISALPIGDNKANGMMKLFERYPELEKKDWMFVGDGMNDVELLKFAPKSVAMGQANDIVKSSAKFVGLSSSEDGWAHTMKTHVL